MSEWRTLCYNGVLYDGYAASDDGKIKSVDRYVDRVSKNGKHYKQFVRGTILVAFVASQYEQVKICINGKDKHILVHKGVLESFIPNPDPSFYTDVNHKDLNKLNNRLENLEWCPRSYNLKYSFENDPVFAKKVMDNLNIAVTSLYNKRSASIV